MAPLLDRLREIEDFTPSRQPTGPEALELLGKLIAYAEHGEELLAAAEKDRDAKAAGEPANHVNELLSPPAPAEEGTTAGESRDQEIADLHARLAALEQEKQTAAAVDQRTVPVETGPATSLGPGVPPAPSPQPSPTFPPASSEGKG